MSVSINTVMTSINNHFSISLEANEFEIVSDGIVGLFGETYIIGQYVWITDSVLNDGVYKVASTTTSKITFEETDLTAENTERTICLYGLAPPKDFIALAAEISTYETSITTGIKSESQGSRSVTYGSGDSNGNNWELVYASRLDVYRRMIDYNSYNSAYNIMIKR